jgi:potassium-transporting ATPase KdpC subunit
MFKRAVKMLLWMVLITGIAYPVLVTLMGQLLFPLKANGSFISVNQKIVGSKLIGQQFIDDKYFWGRPSASGYQSMQSGGSNLGHISATLKQLVKTRQTRLKSTAEMGDSNTIPTYLLFASGSGLDPHLTMDAIEFQKNRVSKVRGFNEKKQQKLEDLIQEKTIKRALGFLGQPHINVLELNLAVDQLASE